MIAKYYLTQWLVDAVLDISYSSVLQKYVNTSPMALSQVLGIHHYEPTYSTTKKSGHPQKGQSKKKKKMILMLVASDSEEGTAVTRAIFNCLRVEGSSGKDVRIHAITCAGLTLHIIPCLEDRTEMARSLKTIANKTSEREASGYVHRVPTVNPTFAYHPEYAMTAVQEIGELQGVIPHFSAGPNKPGATMIFDNDPALLFLSQDAMVEKLFAIKDEKGKSLFKPTTQAQPTTTAPEIIDVDTDTPFTFSNTIIKNLTRRMDKQDGGEVRTAKVILVLWGIGGFASAGVYEQGWKGDALSEGFDSADGAREYFNEIYPGIYSDSQVIWLRRFAHLGLTNIDTHKGPRKLSLPRSGARPGKKGYTFIDEGDNETLWYRRQLVQGHPYYNLGADEVCKIIKEGKFPHFIAPPDDWNGSDHPTQKVEGPALNPEVQVEEISDDSSIESEDLLAETQPEFADTNDIVGEPKAPPFDDNMSTNSSTVAKKRDATSPDLTETNTPSKRGRHQSPAPPCPPTTKSPTKPAVNTPTGKTPEDEQSFHTPMNQDQNTTTRPTTLLDTPMDASTDGDFLLRVSIPPFATLDDVMMILRPLLPSETTLSKIQLASPVESPGPERINFPTYCLIYSPIAEVTSHLYNQFLSINIFNVKCNPVHLRSSDDNDYTCCKINHKLAKMSSDSLIIWMKNDCPVIQHSALANILLTTRDEPQVMMSKYMSLKGNGPSTSSN